MHGRISRQKDWLDFDRNPRLPVAASGYPLAHRQATQALGAPTRALLTTVISSVEDFLPSPDLLLEQLIR
jgi:hypothetical protein